jgi:sRNA-binding carbon storage regulator CsrA
MGKSTLVLALKKTEDLQIGDINIRLENERGNPIRVTIKIQAPREMKITRIKKDQSEFIQRTSED